MTPDWKALGLRGPSWFGAISSAATDPREFGWRRIGEGPVLALHPNGTITVETNSVVAGHPTIESAAAHLRRLGCGAKGGE